MYSKKKIFIVIFLGFITSIILSSYYIAKYDEYRDDGYTHVMLKDETYYHWHQGAKIVEDVKTKPPMKMIGHVTSRYYSPNLNKSIALAVVKNGKKLKGKKLFVPMPNKTIEVTVSDTVFLDKEGDRLNA